MANNIIISYTIYGEIKEGSEILYMYLSSDICVCVYIYFVCMLGSLSSCMMRLYVASIVLKGEEFCISEVAVIQNSNYVVMHNRS